MKNQNSTPEKDARERDDVNAEKDDRFRFDAPDEK